MKIAYKQLVLITLCFLLGIICISCGINKDQTFNGDNKDKEEAIQTDDNINSDEAINITGIDETGAAEEETDSYPLTIRDIPSIELVKELKIGWNLGNTLDATGGGALLSTEMSWGNPLTQEEMLLKVKEAGFNLIRIPVTWENHLGPEPDYTIHTVWLDRVNEIVDYAINNELYVILNMHHEDWHFPSYDNFNKANTILTKVWTQIAERFKDYDEHLIFEGMNEPRMKGTPQEWTGGNAEARDVINQLNQSFVETIRNSGGNNPYRHLMIPTYAASSDPKTWKDFIIPEDDKVIVSIHAYTPYNFALNKKGTAVWSPDNPNDTKDIDYLMNNLYDSFVSKGQAVILGEFGAMDKDNTEARVLWAEYYIQKATEKGVPCIWWDNGAFEGDGELFGLLDRRKLEWQYPEIVEALMSGLKTEE